ncbi:hypothetical protein WN943_027168 [Citrus x changshan-huyou]
MNPSLQLVMELQQSCCYFCLASEFRFRFLSSRSRLLSQQLTIAIDGFGQSKGYGLVQFDNEESAQRKGNCTNKTKFNNIFVKNLTESTTDEDLKKIFGEYGTITSAVVMRDGDGKSKCFGFVNFENADDAAKTVDALNGDREWYVGKAQIISGREKEL